MTLFVLIRGPQIASCQTERIIRQRLRMLGHGGQEFRGLELGFLAILRGGEPTGWRDAMGNR